MTTPKPCDPPCRPTECVDCAERALALALDALREACEGHSPSGVRRSCDDVFDVWVDLLAARVTRDADRDAALREDAGERRRQQAIEDAKEPQ